MYDFVMMDFGYNFDQSDPDWFNVVRPTNIPAFENELGTDDDVYYSVRQTRLGFKTSFPTELGELKTEFEYELFGTGAGAGQTTFRLRHAHFELCKCWCGITLKSVYEYRYFPSSVEYWEVNLTTNVDIGKYDVFRGGVAYGESMQNYMNDSTVDFGIKNNFSNQV